MAESHSEDVLKEVHNALFSVGKDDRLGGSPRRLAEVRELSASV